MAVKLANNFFIELDKQALNSKAIQKEALRVANDLFLAAKNTTIEQFENHPVSLEIKSGPEGGKSQYLSGPSDGNLFSFIGFDAGSNPVDNVVSFLQQSITITKQPQLNYNRNLYKFRVRYPTVDDFQTTAAAPMPRGTSKNWLYAIERGIPGINFYLYKRGKKIAASKSGPAIQAKNNGELQRVRTGARFKNTSYFTGIINKFVSTLGGRNA